MPQFFFNMFDGADLRDVEGVSLPDLPKARVEAVRYAAALLEENGTTVWASEEWRMTITDDGGTTLFTLTLLL